MQNYHILWADDEIELLKPHILFLQNKGYQVTSVNSGSDALEEIKDTKFDIIFLDENMPGMTGLETLSQIKASQPNVPVVMITKSEEEYIMEEAIGSKIADYLIKPLNPNQILISVKKLLDNKRLVSAKTNQGYQQDFMNISMAFSDNMDHNEWIELYKKLVYWELEIDESTDKSMIEVLNTQKNEANRNFANFVVQNYQDWLNDPNIERPTLSHRLLENKLFPHLQSDTPTFLIVIDNLRYDQWRTMAPVISELFNTDSEECYYSILPTSTIFARNALFSGMLPSEMEKRHKQLWVNEDQEEPKNDHEADFLNINLRKNGLKLKSSYHKILKVEDGKQVLSNVNNLLNNDLNVLVYNFVDMLSHARTDMKMIKELAPDESAYRSLTKSWFMHSALQELFEALANKKVKIFLTTDHGTIRVKRPVKIIGDRETSTNLRYKQGKHLSHKDSAIYSVKDPHAIHLPKLSMTSSYAFTKEDSYFVYPNNYNYYVKFYNDTFQHGGISLEEVIVPFISLSPKS